MLRSIPQRVDVYKRHDTYNDVRTLSTTAQFSSLTAGEVNKVLSGNITGGVTNSYPHAGEYIYEVVEVKPSDQASVSYTHLMPRPVPDAVSALRVPGIIPISQYPLMFPAT